MTKLKFTDKLALRAIVEFLVLAVILSLIGYFIYCKIDVMLKESLEESVALQARSIAVGLRNQFDEKFHRLHAAASLAANGKVALPDIDDVFLVGAIGEEMGIVNRNNEAFRGPPLPNRLMERFQDVFNGEDIVIYDKEMGLVFAVPVVINNQDCILYNSNPTDWVRKTFHATSYNGEGTIVLINGSNGWMMLSEGAKLIEAYPKSGWLEILQQFEAEGTDYTAMYHKVKGESFFMYIAYISEQMDFSIAGYAPWKAVAVGIDYIYMVMLVTFFVILLMLIFAVRYMMRTREAESLAREKVLADSANKAKSDFLSNMSHEIRTPINAIMGMDEMILRETKESSTLEYAENLQGAARNLLGLVNDILDFSKIEAGNMEIIPVEYHISSLLNDLVNMIQARANKKGLEFKINVSPNTPSVLFGDEIRIKQVITNILTNAVKYTEKGSVTLDVDYKEKGTDSIILVVKVIDTGIGIKPEDISKLFSAFERIEEERNRTIEGTGLGMNITQRLLKLMGSKLYVDSIYGKGSTFSFQIEQKVMNSEPVGDFQQNYKHSLNQHKEYHVSFTAPNARI
ncbi:MAG: hypothetical protein IJ563_05230, partial [Selenomonadaceae bacterium]|nr:hypothetical protein [Selenomonadaceae bacterium]